MTRAGGEQRSVLFLQGPLSPLYRQIGDLLAARGFAVHRINLCAGDRLHWRRPGAVDYRGPLGDWAGFVRAVLLREGITDVVLHGDRRVYHRVAAAEARAVGAEVIATELGYIRPDFMTIERDATSTGSHFPDDAETIRRIAAAVDAPDLALLYPGSFAMQAVPDVVYNLTNVATSFLFPHYRRHTIYHPIPDYAGWALRLVGAGRRRRAAEAAFARITAAATPFFVFAMQLEGDFQIRDHSPFGSLRPALGTVFASFARHAPKETRLVVKNHPLDNGLERWRTTIARLAEAHGIAGRVDFLDGGGLEPLLRASRGMVTVNSSAGLEAVMWGCPVKVLAPAIYDVEGLTDRQPLDGFWKAPMRPDTGLATAFVRALAQTVQVKGTIYSDAGCRAAAAAMAQRIADRQLNTAGAYIDPPPRLARARAGGAPL
jgi:capsular polysaccharide export protein